MSAKDGDEVHMFSVKAAASSMVSAAVTGQPDQKAGANTSAAARQLVNYCWGYRRHASNARRCVCSCTSCSHMRHTPWQQAVHLW